MGKRNNNHSNADQQPRGGVGVENNMLRAHIGAVYRYYVGMRKKKLLVLHMYVRMHAYVREDASSMTGSECLKLS